MVILPNCTLGVRHRVVAEARDDYGERAGLGWGPVSAGLHNGRRTEGADGLWTLAVDLASWPIRQDDLVMSVDGATWLVATAHAVRNSADPYVDYAIITARLRSVGGTEPGDSWFVARYTPGLEDVPPPSGPPVLEQANLWTGNGPPPAGDFGARQGDEYVDLTTGVVYRLGDEVSNHL